jgi:protein-S-isoprenylcysteine O-methyltransferase Ste14
MTTAFRSIILAWTGFFERYILSSAYFWLAYVQGIQVRTLATTWPMDRPFFTPELAHAANSLILFLMQLLIGVFLLSSRPPRIPPQRLREVFVPLCSCTYFILYAVVGRLPDFWKTSLVVGGAPPTCLIAGLALGIAGPALSLWGVVSLGKSFGIFVSAREPVLKGAYRYVRHPIYLGYFCIWLGLCLVNLSPAILLLVAGHMLLFKARSGMEEACLAEASAEYAAYLQTTSAFLPRWKRTR